MRRQRPLFPPSPAAFSVGDTTLAGISEGEGAPLVFIHGTLGTWYDFEYQRRAFRDRYHVLAYSRRFHPPNPEGTAEVPYDATEHARDLERILTAQGPAHVVGTSYGGYVALLLALRCPGLFCTLVLAEPPILPLLQWSDEGRREFDAFLRTTVFPARDAFREDAMERGVACFVEGVTGQAGMWSQLPAEIRRRLLAAGPELRQEFLSDFGVYMPAVRKEFLEALQLPVLLVEGEQSPRFFGIIVEALAAAIPRMRRVCISRAGHTMHSANSEEFNAAVEEFLSAYRTI
jgi:pimeloyl-ACP methyl ester carboxylesterase